MSVSRRCWAARERAGSVAVESGTIHFVRGERGDEVCGLKWPSWSGAVVTLSIWVFILVGWRGKSLGVC